MRLSNQFLEESRSISLQEARAISKVLMKEIPHAIDGFYAAACELVENGYRFHSGSCIPQDSVVDGHLHGIINGLLANNLHYLGESDADSFRLAQQIVQSGVYDPKRLAPSRLDGLAAAR